MDKGLHELGAKVAARRRELRLSQIELQEQGGPSTTTVSRLEIGEGKRPQRETLEKLDRSLQWAPGTAASILKSSDAEGLVNSEECDLTAGVAESVDAASKLVRAFQRKMNFEQVDFESLDNRTRIFGLCWLLGREIEDIDLLTERDADELLSSVKSLFMRESRRLEMANDAYENQILPHGFTRAQVDQELRNGGTYEDAVSRLIEKQPFDVHSESKDEQRQFSHSVFTSSSGMLG